MGPLFRVISLLALLVLTPACVSSPDDCLVGTHADPLGSLTAGVLMIPLLPVGLVASTPCLFQEDSVGCAESVMDFVTAPAVGVAYCLCWLTAAPVAAIDDWFDDTHRERRKKAEAEAEASSETGVSP